VAISLARALTLTFSHTFLHPTIISGYRACKFYKKIPISHSLSTSQLISEGHHPVGLEMDPEEII